ncbi:unnamed protein product [Arctia plantaginis]|uniref:Uncharacterized protein n=1 Tax=Arctia plantaginis TaxID=874455 RepID=A0A8S1BTH4_ARCPL|nr:unnamed protein product [Arctia plantaginis]
METTQLISSYSRMLGSAPVCGEEATATTAPETAAIRHPAGATSGAPIAAVNVWASSKNGGSLPHRHIGSFEATTNSHQPT